MQNTRKMAQKHAPKPFLTCLWEILCEPLLLKGQFHGFTHQLNGQFQGICLEKSQPSERTFAGRAAPLEQTFGPVNALDKPTFALIPWDFHDLSPERKKNACHPDRRPSAAHITLALTLARTLALALTLTLLSDP
jgi:hypothetical protein